MQITPEEMLEALRRQRDAARHCGNITLILIAAAIAVITAAITVEMLRRATPPTPPQTETAK